MRSEPGLTGERPALDLAIALGRDGRSRIAARSVRFPWSLGRGYAGDRGVTVIPQVAGAGLLSGDRVSQRIRVERDASLRLVSAGATLVYGGDAGPAQSEWLVEVQPGACAILGSEPYVLLSGSALQLETTFVVAPGGVLIAAEGIVCDPSGTPVSFRTTSTIRCPERGLLFHDRQAATWDDILRAGALCARPTAFASVICVDSGIERGSVVGAVQDGEVDLGPGVWAGAARLARGTGIGIRIAASSGGLLRAAMRRALDRLTGKPSLPLPAGSSSARPETAERVDGEMVGEASV